MAGAVIAIILLTVLLPDVVRPGPAWALPVLEAALLVAVVIVDPGRIDRRSREIRLLSIGLIALLAFGSFVSAALLVDALIEGGAITNEARALLEAGAQVWSSTWLSFALLYWELDCGGAASRAHGMPRQSGLRLPAATQSGSGAAVVAPAVRGLPVSQPYELDCFQSDRRDAPGGLGKATHGHAVGPLLGGHRTGGCACGQRFLLDRHRRDWASSQLAACRLALAT